VKPANRPDDVPPTSDPEQGGLAAVPRHYPRRAGLYVLALWGRPFTIRVDAEGEMPRLLDEVIQLPANWQGVKAAPRLYRAAACHAVAHRIHVSRAFPVGDLRPRQQVLVGLVEDARVEALAIGRFPGLQRLWREFHVRPLPDTLSFPVLTRRLARALLLGLADDDNAWIRKGVDLFRARPERWHDPDFARDVGLQLAHDLGQMRAGMDDGKPFQVAAYRDDNTHLWEQADTLLSAEADASAQGATEPQQAFLREADQGRVLELAPRQGPDPGGEALQLREVEQDAALEFRRHADTDLAPDRTYPEWDHRLQRVRQDWCTVRERPAPAGANAWVQAVLREHRPVLKQMQRVAQAIRLEKVQRARRQLDGDDLDFDAAVHALTDLRTGREPDMRIQFRVRPLHDRGLACLLLLDLSESGNDEVYEAGRSVLDLAREAGLLLGHALESLGESFAIHGFHSRGRHDVGYCRPKDFDDAFDAAAMARIAGLQGRYSTRLGTALRHGTAQLLAQPQRRKLLLVVSDGVPSDIDVYDPDYLAADVHQAVQEAARAGVQSFCLGLDANAAARVARMFGRQRCRTLDHVGRLPDLLPQVLLGLVRRY
jgi:nitric oxide reductase NorD protein